MMCEAFPGVSCSKEVTENALFCRDVLSASVQPSPFANKSVSDLSPPLLQSYCHVTLLLFQPHLLTCLRLFLSPLIYLLPTPINLLLIPVSPLVSYFCHFTPQYCLSVTVSFCLSGPLFLFLMFLLLAPYHILPVLSCLRLLSPPALSLSISISLCC